MMQHSIVGPFLLGMACSAFGAECQDAVDTKAAVSPKATTALREKLKGAIEPLLLSDERDRFLRAAGADGELVEKEVEADRGRERGFVRSFDDWANLLLFDYDKNHRITWYEASGYRREVRSRLLKQFDRDGSSRFEDGELAGLSESVQPAALRKILLELQAEAGAPKLENGAAAFDAPRAQLVDKEAEKAAFDQQFQKNKAAILRMFDANANGQVDPDEAEAFRAWRLRMVEMAFDANRDGVLDEQELARIRSAGVREGFEARRKFDGDNDGLLNYEEWMAWSRDAGQRVLAEWKEKNDEYVENLRKFARANLARFDADGDGHIFGDETLRVIEAYDAEVEQAGR